MIYFSCDADNAGSRVGRAVMSNDPDKVREVASIIERGEVLIEEWVSSNEGSIISKGGDEARFTGTKNTAENIEELRQKYFKETGFTLSVGIGSTMREGETGLIAAKLTGKDKTVKYNDQVEKQVKELSSKEKSQAEKESEAYFKSERRLEKGLMEATIRRDDPKELSELSAKQEAGKSLVGEWTKQNGGTVVYSSGGQAIVQVPNKALKAIEEFRTNYFNLTGATCSVGIGKKISEATDARMLAKLKGKNRSEMFTEATRKELKIRLDEKGDPESKKIALALDPADVDGAQPVHTEESLTDQGQQAPAQAAERQPEMQKPPGDVVVHEPDETPPSGNDGYDDFGYRSGL